MLCLRCMRLDAEGAEAGANRLLPRVHTDMVLATGYGCGQVASGMGMGKDPDRMRGIGTREQARERASAAGTTVRGRQLDAGLADTEKMAQEKLLEHTADSC